MKNILILLNLPTTIATTHWLAWHFLTSCMVEDVIHLCVGVVLANKLLEDQILQDIWLTNPTDLGLHERNIESIEKPCYDT